MISPKPVLFFVTGCVAGMLLTVAALTNTSQVHAAPAAPTPFADVPAKHVAATAVSSLKAKGIITGYPGNTYRGSAPVTRYELAVALARFAQYYDTSKAPLATSSVPPPTAAPSWAAPSLSYLASNNFLSPQSPTLKSPGTAPITAKELADDLATVLARISDRSMPLTNP